MKFKKIEEKISINNEKKTYYVQKKNWQQVEIVLKSKTLLTFYLI